ncbi:hypothetical protein N7488_012093 [Penicillium malachiteum]|nr:hypothetical protein N7488_012093 [Penicillium malachiteum]
MPEPIRRRFNDVQYIGITQASILRQECLISPEPESSGQAGSSVHSKHVGHCQHQISEAPSHLATTLSEASGTIVNPALSNFAEQERFWVDNLGGELEKYFLRALE